MISYDAKALTLRRVLGYFPTGMAWVLVASLVFGRPEPFAWLAELQTSLGLVGVGLSLIILLFCAGAALTPVNFSFAVALGSLADGVSSFLRRHLPRPWVRWLDENEVISLMTLGERRLRMRNWMTDRGIPHDLGAVSTGNAEWRIYKLLVMSRSAVVAQEVLDLEAEANLYAGLALPLFILAGLVFPQMHGLGIALLVLGAIAPLRFQYARHREIDEIANAYVSLYGVEHDKAETTEGVSAK